MNGGRADIAGWPQPPVPPVDPADALAVAGYGTPVLAAALAPAMPDDGDETAAAALVAEMDNIRLALQSRDPRALRRASGLLGRLLGRDVEAQAQAETLRAQLGVLLVRSDRHADALEAAVMRRADAAAHAEAGAAAIGRWVDAAALLLQDPVADGAGVADGWATDTPQARLRRRLDHLRGVAATRHMDAAQLRLLHAQGLELLERYRRIRDVLLPAWEQNALAERVAREPARLAASARSHDQIVAEVAAMQARLR